MDYPKNLWLAGLYAGLIALALNVALQFIGLAMGIMRMDLPVVPPQTQIGYPQVIFVTLFSTVMATLVYWVMRRFFKASFKAYLVVAALVFTFELFTPFLFVPGAPLSMRIWLELMHFTTAGPILYLFWKVPEVKKKR